MARRKQTKKQVRAKDRKRKAEKAYVHFCIKLSKPNPKAPPKIVKVRLLKSKKWYAVMVRPAHETKVRARLMRLVRIQEKKHLIGRIIIPRAKEIVLRNRKKTIFNRQIYKGYVLVEMRAMKEGIATLMSVEGVMHLLPNNDHPSPLKESEILPILESEAQRKEEAAIVVRLDFQEGDTIQVIKGTWEGQTAKVTAIRKDERGIPSIDANVSILGTDVPVTFNHWEVKR